MLRPVDLSDPTVRSRMRPLVAARWEGLDDDELDGALEQWDRLVGVIRLRTGQAIHEIEAQLDQILAEIAPGG